MPETFSIDELFGQTSAGTQPASAPREDDEDMVYTIDELFQAAPTPTPNAQPQTGGQQVSGIPYPVAPPDALGLPKDLEQPSGITRFAEELPGVISDVAQAAKGVIRDTLWEDM